MFYDVLHGVASGVFVVGYACFFSRNNASELEETFEWIIKVGWCIKARVHQVDELDDVNIRACQWNMNS